MLGLSIPPRQIDEGGDGKPSATLLGYVWRMSGRHQYAICGLALVVAALSMVPLELQRRIINGIGQEFDMEAILILGAVYAGVILVHAGLKFVLRMYQGWLSESAIRFNRITLSRIYRRRASQASEDAADGADKKDDGDRHSGEAVSVIGPEIDKLGGFVGEGLSQPTVNVGILLAIGGYMVVVEPVVALVSLVLIVPQAILVPVVQHYINRLVERRVALMRELGDMVAEMDDAGRDNAGGDGDDRSEQKDLDGKLRRIYANRMRTFVLKFMMKGLSNVLSAFAPLGVLLVGGYLALQGETTIGVVVAFISGVDRMADPLRELLAYYRTAALANVQHRMIARWM